MSKTSRFALILCAVFVFTLTAQVSGGNDESSFKRNPESVSAGGASAPCLTEVALDDLRRGKLEIEARAKDLASREQELKAREKALEDEISKIQAIRDDIASRESLSKRENEEKVNKLVETFETMSPKSASQVLSSLDETLAVATMSKMSTQRLAKLLNVMEPSRSTRLSEIMAGVTRAKKSASSGAAVVTSVSANAIAKGGENNADHSKTTNNAARPEVDPTAAGRP